MRILLDHNMPVQVSSLLIGHQVSTTRSLGWDLLRNGHLIAVAEQTGFDVLLSGDKKMIRQYTNLHYVIKIVVVGNTTLDVLNAYFDDVLSGINQATSGTLTVVSMPRTKEFRKLHHRTNR